MASTLGKRWWIVALAVAVVIAGIALLAGLLSPKGQPLIPEQNEFYRIRAIPYDLINMTCSHKACLYLTYLQQHGWTCWFVVGRIRGGQDNQTGHAWVVVLDKEGVRRLCDPTGPVGGPSGYPEKSYHTYKVTAYYEKGTIIQ